MEQELGTGIMATKGKIQQALEKAKQRRQSLGSDVVTTSDSMTAAQRHSAAQATFDAPELPFDREQCIANHILINDGNGLSNASAVASYRMLRTRILHRTRANKWNIIGLTSPGAEDGKSVTALNLALAIAREKNNNVFLIDLDIRKPSVCEYLGVAPPIEINDFFNGAANAKDVFFSIGIENLTLAGTRTSSDNSSELLATGQIEELFKYIRQVAAEPLILVDLPPILTTDDALVMAPKVDACLLVLAEGESRRDSTAKALEMLADFNLAGIVLNRSKTVVKDYYGS